MVRVDLYFYVALILFFLARDSKKRLPHAYRKTKIFRAELAVIAFLCIDEAASWLANSRPGFMIANFVTHSLLYLGSLVPLTLWLAYLDEAILENPGKRAARTVAYASINVAVAILVLANPFTGYLFTVGAGNVYARGPGAFLIMFMNIALFAGYAISIVPYRRFVSGRVAQVILILGLFPSIGGIIQTLFYGMTLTWPAMSLVAVGAYLVIEREDTRRDYVTGLCNRAQLEDRMKFKIARRQPFSLIMIDMDRFKEINDRFGHDEGDEALAAVGNLLSKSIKHGDTVYRYAGDEFMLLVESADERAVTLIVARLFENLSRHNDASGKPYGLSFSIGGAHYDGSCGASVRALCSAADEAMYAEKRRKSERVEQRT